MQRKLLLKDDQSEQIQTFKKYVKLYWKCIEKDEITYYNIVKHEMGLCLGYIMFLVFLRNYP